VLMFDVLFEDDEDEFERFFFMKLEIIIDG
jgi:hypothetical protein